MKIIRILPAPFFSSSIVNLNLNVNFLIKKSKLLSQFVTWTTLGSRPRPLFICAGHRQCDDSKSTSGDSSTSKSWATSIIEDQKKKLKALEEEGSTKKGLLRGPVDPGVTSFSSEGVNNKTKNTKRPAIFRRRLEDSSWTTEKMDDKLIWVDCEMTGLDYNKEMIMEIGCVITDQELKEIARQPSIVISVPDDMLNNMDAWCIKHHGDSGLTESCRQSSLTSGEVDEQLFQFVQKYTKNKECPMAGNSIYMDRIFISKQFPKFHAHFHYRNVDVSSIKELVRRWFPNEYSQAPKKKFSHRVLDDIEDSIAELNFYRSAIFKEPTERQEDQRTNSN